MSSIPTNIDFATEVKTDRLALLWKITLAPALLMALLMISLTSVSDHNIAVWVGSPLALAAGCFAARFFLKRQQTTRAAWAYTLGGVAAVVVALLTGETQALQIAPFAFVVVVFVAGLLISPLQTLAVAGIAAACTIAVPVIVTAGFAFFGLHQFIALLLIFIAAAMAAQVTGELYAVTEWALLNYQRERRTNNELFENRQKLENTLRRSEALSDKLQITNMELENARQAAETAKNFRGQFLANMSHELRTPLNAIIGFSETMLKFPMMYDSVDLPQEYTADMNQIYTSGKQLLTLINDILDLAKVDAGKLEVHVAKVDLEPIINSTMATANGLIGSKSITLRKSVTNPVPTVFGDENRIRQVLLNLYSNAVKFTDVGEIELVVRSVDEGVQISVRDTGSGIPAEQLNTVFEEFRQASNTARDPRAGAGLGLAISRQLVTMMQGRIWAESELGVGSTFHVLLPEYQVEALPEVQEKVVS